MDDKEAFINTICSRVDGIDKDKVSLIYDKLEKLAELQANLVSVITWYSESEYGVLGDNQKDYARARKAVDDYFEELLILFATLK
jgi:hypothetical protein